MNLIIVALTAIGLAVLHLGFTIIGTFFLMAILERPKTQSSVLSTQSSTPNLKFEICNLI